MVEIRCKDGSSRMGRVVQLEGSRAAIQVFEGTNGLSLTNTRTRFKGKPMELPLSLELLGRVFNGSGRPIDGLGEIYAEKSADINGLPLNPVSRVYPRNYINTGISSIDALRQGNALSSILATGIFDTVTKMKYDVPNDHLELFDTYTQKIDEAIRRGTE